MAKQNAIYNSRVNDVLPNIIGIEWNSGSSSSTLTRINISGDTIPSSYFNRDSYFNEYPIHGNMWRATLDASGTATYGTDAKGTGLTLTNDYVMVRIPRVYYKFEKSGNYWRWWISPTLRTGFSLHPAFYQRGHSASPVNQIYVGAYHAHDAGSSKLGSKSGSTALVSTTIANFETYGGNIGTGWGIMNFHTLCLLQLLFYVEYASFDSQTKVGAGYTNSGNTSALASGTVSAKEGANGTSSGTSDTEGVSWRGIENLWGNIWISVIGYNTTDTEHRIVNRDGTGTLAAELTAGNYEAVTSPIPLNGTTHKSGTDAGTYCHGYISGLALDSAEILGSMFVPDVLSGASNTYLTDYHYSHQSGISQTGILRSGGHWNLAAKAGLGYRDAYRSPANVDAYIGGRVELIL